jgi:hypothetical protein
MEVMKLYQAIKKAFGFGPVVHPVDRGMAKRWIKQRLLAVFPELRGNPQALESAYHSLSLEPRAGDEGDLETVFELKVHREPGD